MKFKFNALNQTGYFLIIYTIMAIVASTGALDRIEGNPVTLNPNLLWHLGATVGLAWAIASIYNRIAKRKKIMWNTIITGLILFLVLHHPIPEISASDPSTWTPLLYPALATLLAMISKLFLEWKGSPPLNPVVFGLLGVAGLAYLIPSLEAPFVSWWGANFQGYLSLVLILIWTILGLKAWRKYPTLISFLVGYAGMILVTGQGVEVLQFTFTDATIYFLAAIMLIEPKSSPMKKNQQIMYGILAAVLLGILKETALPHTELLAIAGANLFHLGLKWQMLRPKPVAVAP